jgi:hypothetical protein
MRGSLEAVLCLGGLWRSTLSTATLSPPGSRRETREESVGRELEKRKRTALVAWEREFKTNKDAAGSKLDAVLESTTGGE